MFTPFEVWVLKLTVTMVTGGAVVVGTTLIVAIIYMLVKLIPPIEIEDD